MRISPGTWGILRGTVPKNDTPKEEESKRPADRSCSWSWHRAPRRAAELSEDGGDYPAPPRPRTPDPTDSTVSKREREEKWRHDLLRQPAPPREDSKARGKLQHGHKSTCHGCLNAHGPLAQRILAGRASTSLAARASRRALSLATLHTKCARIPGGPLLEHGVWRVPAHKMFLARVVGQRQPSVAARPAWRAAAEALPAPTKPLAGYVRSATAPRPPPGCKGRRPPEDPSTSRSHSGACGIRGAKLVQVEVSPCSWRVVWRLYRAQ